MGSRLENFFWRIWGNKDVRDRIRGRQVATLFSSISEGGFIRTTPTQSPRNSRSIGNFRTPIPDRSPTKSPSFTLGSPSSGTSLSNEVHNDSRQSIVSNQAPSPTNLVPVSASEAKESHGILPPILKKPFAGSAIKLNKSARILSPPPTETRSVEPGSAQLANISSTNMAKRGSGTIRFDDKTRSPPARASSSTALKTEKLPGSQGQPSQKSTRKKATFMVGAGPSKKRPVAVRQRSSQTSSSAASSVTSPPPLTSSLASHRGILNVAESPRAFGQSTLSPLVQNPRSSNRRPTQQETTDRTPHDESSGGESSQSSIGEASGETADGGDEAVNKSPLVDPNFRARFVDKNQIQPPQRSFASLSSLAPKSTAVAAAPASYQAAGMMGFGIPTQQVGRAKNNVEIAKEAPRTAAGDGQGLTRTKSQLTFLLQKDRQTSEEGKRQSEGGRRRRTPP